MRSTDPSGARRLTLCILAAAAMALPLAAQAHAFLARASPAASSTVHASPPDLTLSFTQGVQTAFSTVVVKGSAGQRVDKNDLHNAPGNAKRVLIGLLPLKPGAYTVTWHVTSVDTHKTEGVFTFTVSP
ncbi:MAG TPA: copper resistance protein CopC [Caulobacteraceae bacterium]|nr:copper resistance protein CopC [Caulobacteraceae bacterium]